MNDSTLPLPPGSVSSGHALKISVLGGPDRGRVYTWEQSHAIVGRGETADIRLTDPTVSQFHIELIAEKQGIRFQDKESRNGIRIVGVRVESGVAPSGCEFSLGATTLRVELVENTISPPEPGLTSFGGLIGMSPSMRALFARLTQLASSDCSILLQGPTGTGKELAAAAIHKHSIRKDKPFLIVDCTTLQKDLAGSRLFGHERGSFTGASDRHIGLFEAANGGTVFLDEIGDLPLDMQPLLLRVLEQKQVLPHGTNRHRTVDIRIIAATLHDLRADVNQKRFREDLYYRLAGATVTLPSLDQHPEDIPLLVQHFLERISATQSMVCQIEPEARAALAARKYQGNIRELRNVVENLAILAKGPLITLQAVMAEREQDSYQRRQNDGYLESSPVSLRTGASIAPFKEAKQAAVQQFERSYLLDLLAAVGNNLSRAARIADLERHAFRDLLKRHGFYRPPDENS